ncbi:MAG TPA: serine/threonine-protein kinase [Kofleriaceae bacterium]|nr:serine/threonine-protein kinase [Kofleriaceae bacterium]
MAARGRDALSLRSVGEHTVSELGRTELGESAQAELARAATSPPPADIRGEAIGRFIVLETLGAGGMGVVYAAYDPNLDRKVALKLLSRPVAGSEEARIRMLREAQAMARIDHPNVLRVFEAGQLDDQIYIAMEFAPGGTLRKWLATPRSQAEIVEAYAQAGRGVAAAHAAGLVHRDFKPDNVMLLGDGRVRVTDFGLVGMIGDAPAPTPAQLDAPISDTTPLSQELTRTGALMGTPSYMAPEQFRGQHAGPAADQFAFCVALYAALTKQRPFDGATFAELCANVVAGQLRPIPREARVPSRIASALMRGMSTEPDQRFASMDALLARLDTAPRRRTWLAATVAVIALGGTAGFVALRSPAELCSGARGKLATTWSPARAAMLAEAFATAPRPDAIAVVERVAPIFDRWGATWEQAYVGACEDTRVRAIQSEHLLDLRMDCLARRLDEAHAALDALGSGGGDAVDHAFDLAGGLPDVSACANTSALASGIAAPNAVTSASVAAIRDKLSRARAERKLAHYPLARDLATTAVADARAIGYAPVIAEALLELGSTQSKLVEHAAAATLGEAMRVAIAAGANETAILAASERIDDISMVPPQFAVGDELGKIAQALADRSAPPARTSVELDDAIGDLLAAEGALDASQAIYEQAVALATKQLGADDLRTVQTVGKLAMLSVKRHRWNDARAAFQRVADAEQRAYGSDHPAYATALDHLANIDASLGQSAKSKDLRERSLAIRIAALGPDHPEVAASYVNLGALYNEAGDLATAKTYFEKALAILAKAYGDDSVQTDDALVDLGNTVAHQGDRVRGRELVEHALANEEAVYAADDQRLASTLDNLGLIERDDKHYDVALAMFDRAERITTKAFGPKDPRAAEFLGETAATYRVMNKLTEAKDALDRTVAAIAASYGPDSPPMGTALGNVGLLEFAMKDYAGGLSSFQKAQAIFEAKLGKDHPSVALCLMAEGEALDRLKRFAEAIPTLERALAIAKQFPPGQLAQTHFYIGDSLYTTPATRARGRDEVKTALALYDKAHDVANATAMKTWLRKH